MAELDININFGIEPQGEAVELVVQMQQDHLASSNHLLAQRALRLPAFLGAIAEKSPTDIRESVTAAQAIGVDEFMERGVGFVKRSADPNIRREMAALLIELGYNIFGTQAQQYLDRVTVIAFPPPPIIVKPAIGTEALARQRKEIFLPGTDLPPNHTTHSVLRRKWIDVYARIITSYSHDDSGDTIWCGERRVKGKNVGIFVFVDGITRWYDTEDRQIQYATESGLASKIIARVIADSLLSHVELNDAVVCSAAFEAHMAVVQQRNVELQQQRDFMGAATVHIGLLFQQSRDTFQLKHYCIANREDAAPLVIYKNGERPQLYLGGIGGFSNIGEPFFNDNLLPLVMPTVVTLSPGDVFCMYSDAVLRHSASGKTLAPEIIDLHTKPNLLIPGLDNFDDLSAMRVKLT